MKKVLLGSVLALASVPFCAVAQQSAGFGQQSGQSAQKGITINDPAEYNAYSAAIGQASPQARAAAIESFLTTYPNSAAKADILARLLTAYQQTGDIAKVQDAAKRLLKVDPNNLPALAVSVYVEDQQASQKTNPAEQQPLWDDAASLAQKGLAATAPAGVSAADFDKQKAQVAPIFHDAIATDDLGKKDYDGAIKEYRTSLQAYPPEQTTQPGPALNDTLQLGLAYVQKPAPAAAASSTAGSASTTGTAASGSTGSTDTNASGASGTTTGTTGAAGSTGAAAGSAPPPCGQPAAASTTPQKDPKDLQNGIWFLARAAAYAPPQFAPQILANANYWYKKFHGSADGFDQVQAQAKQSLFPPDNFAITPAPPPPSNQDLAHQAVTGTPNLATLALGDKEFILGNGCADDANKVWDTVKGKRTEVPGKVISASPDSVQLAVSDDAQQNNQADFTINMSKPLTTVPTVGSTITLTATFASFTQNPSMIVMSDGEEAAAAPKKPTPTHRAAPRRRG